MSVPAHRSLRTALASGSALLLLAAGGVIAFADARGATWAEEHEEAEGEGADHPDAAMAWRRLAWRDENGGIAPQAWEQARAHRAANAAHWASIDNAGISRLSWVERGPGNIAGRTRSLAIHPANPNEMWAGSAGGGIWHSLNAGLTWAPVDDHLGRLAIGCLALDPTNPAVLYAGTGEGYYNGDAQAGVGILRSTDGGVSFQRLPATASFFYVNRIAIQPTNPQLLLAAVRDFGVVRSTNGGASWTTVAAAANCTQVVFDPNDANKAVAAIYDGAGYRVFVSQNAGLTWNPATTSPTTPTGVAGRIELAYARSVPDLVYASCANGGGTLWRSTDGGLTFALRTTAGASGVSWYCNELWVDPTDPNFVVVGGTTVCASANGGATITEIGNGYINTMQPHDDIHGLFADPGYDGVANRRLWVVTDGGVYTAADIRTASTTQGWLRRDQSCRTTQFYGACGDAASGRITGGTQDNGGLTLQLGNQTAQLTFGGDGGFVAMDRTNPTVLYGEYVYARIWRSTDGGNSGSYIHTSGLTEAGATTCNFIAPFVLDPSAQSRMYVGGSQLWRTNDARAATVAWSSVKASVGSPISAIAVSPFDSNVVWVGHNDGRVYRTANATAASPTWVAVDDNGAANPLPGRYVGRILLDATAAGKAWIGLGGFVLGNLVVTTNDGASFASASGSGTTALPPAAVRGICQHPTLPDHLYVATEIGIYATVNSGAQWSTTNDGPIDTACDEINFLSGSTTLLAATYGRGLWTSAVLEPVVADDGPGCAGSRGVPILTATPPRLVPPANGSAVFTCLNLPFASLGLLALGFSDAAYGASPLPLDLTAYGMPGCFLRASPDATLLAGALIGAATWNLTLRPDPSLVGLTLYAQAFGLDAAANPGGLSASNALRCTLGY